MAKNTTSQRGFALALIIALFAFVIYAMIPYVKGVFGAIILYVLFQPLYDWFVKKKMNKGISAVLVIIISIFIILVPLFLLLSVVAGQVGPVFSGAMNLADNLDQLDEVIKTLDIENIVEDILSNMGTFLKNLAASGVSKATSLMVILTIMYFMFYFLLVNQKSIAEGIKFVTPFNKKNTNKLLDEGRNITYSIVLSTGLIAVVQGFLVSIGFYFAGIPGATLWGIVTGVLSFLPVVGSPLVWGPAVIFLLIKQEYTAGIALLIWGIVVIMNIDNVLRPLIQKQVADIHPLVSIIGVFIGIPFFGLVGLIIGPLLLSYLILTIEMYQEEYV